MDWFYAIPALESPKRYQHAAKTLFVARTDQGSASFPLPMSTKLLNIIIVPVTLKQELYLGL